MKPETRCAFNAVMAAHWSSATESVTECEAAFLGGMMEAARLCRGEAEFHFGSGALGCAELIESSVKGE